MLLTLKNREWGDRRLEQPTLLRVGTAVRRCRLSQGLTQEQLAEKIGSSYTYISNLERGQRNVTIQTLERIAAACHTDVFRMMQLGGQEDETMTEILALLLRRDAFDRQKALNVLHEMFRPRP